MYELTRGQGHDIKQAHTPDRKAARGLTPRLQARGEEGGRSHSRDHSPHGLKRAYLHTQGTSPTADISRIVRTVQKLYLVLSQPFLHPRTRSLSYPIYYGLVSVVLKEMPDLLTV